MRVQTDRASFGAGDAVKRVAGGGSAAWPTDDYLNIWVCTLGGGLLGYAQFPGGPRATDGVVILNTAFGTEGTAAAPFDLGRTADPRGRPLAQPAPHLGRHPRLQRRRPRRRTRRTARAPTTGKPTFPTVSCNNGPNGDMFMNYMDYVDDAAMFMFTAGQVSRMNACLAGPRKSFLGA